MEENNMEKRLQRLEDEMGGREPAFWCLCV